MVTSTELFSPELLLIKVSQKTHKEHRDVCNMLSVLYLLFYLYLGIIQVETAARKGEEDLVTGVLRVPETVHSVSLLRV